MEACGDVQYRGGTRHLPCSLLRAEVTVRSLKQRYLDNQQGKIGYMLAWLMGVPASVLLAIFLLRGCN
jgi:hypothetical protein